MQLDSELRAPHLCINLLSTLNRKPLNKDRKDNSHIPKWNHLEKKLRKTKRSSLFFPWTPTALNHRDNMGRSSLRLCNSQLTSSATGVCGRWWTPRRASRQVPLSLRRRGRRSRGRRWDSGRTSIECTPPTAASPSDVCGSRCTSARNTGRRG